MSPQDLLSVLFLAGIQMESRSEVEYGTWIAREIAKKGYIAEFLRLRLVPLAILVWLLLLGLFLLMCSRGFTGNHID